MAFNNSNEFILLNHAEESMPTFDDLSETDADLAMVNLLDDWQNQYTNKSAEINPNKVLVENMYMDIVQDVPTINVTQEENILEGSFTPGSDVTENLYSPQFYCYGSDLSPGSLSDVSTIASPSNLLSPMPSPCNITPPVSPAQTFEESITLVMSPRELFEKTPESAPSQVGPIKKKRGRKSKAELGIIDIKPMKEKKPKAYEVQGPYENKNLERKRLNAINAKRHRDLQKQAKDVLQQQLTEVKAERDNLKDEVVILKQREEKLKQQLEMFKNYLGNQAKNLNNLLQIQISV